MRKLMPLDQAVDRLSGQVEERSGAIDVEEAFVVSLVK
jgi:hypothetical protein